jgi:hypothetical protein
VSKTDLQFLRHQKGTAPRNLIDGKKDESDWNIAKNNYFGPNIAADHVDIKEGTSNGYVMNNKFDGTGQTGENGSNNVVNCKGGNYTIYNNMAFNLKFDGILVRYFEMNYSYQLDFV